MVHLPEEIDGCCFGFLQGWLCEECPQSVKNDQTGTMNQPVDEWELFRAPVDEGHPTHQIAGRYWDFVTYRGLPVPLHEAKHSLTQFLTLLLAVTFVQFVRKKNPDILQVAVTN